MLPPMVSCLACATSNPDGARFCNGCGAPLASAASAAGAVREERKVVTVLFADLAGYTARSETLDPEDVRAFLLPYYDVLTSEITRHGGIVDRFLGDGVMALFGAPTAHEDDPERAVRAALRILERIGALGLDLHARIGINTGPVLFATGGGAGRDDAVTGDAVNTASRLQALAPVDGIVVGEPTYRATVHRFAFETLQAAQVKGKAEPLSVWRVLAPLARPAGELPAETTPFVGRELERSLLVSLFERSRWTPSTELVTIVAEPGLGKSRLVRELARHVEALPDLVTWRVGRCLPYGEGIGLWALGEIVKAQAGILDTDDQATLAAKLEAVLVEPDASMRTWMRDRLAPLVGLETSTQPPQQAEAFTAWRRFLESIAADGPTVLVVEDLHWADDALVSFLSHLAEHTVGLPLLVVATARPELEERHPAFLARTRRNTVLSLAALADADIGTLLAATLGDTSPEVRSTVLARAGGSPLYAEQLGAMLRDRLIPIAGGMLDEDAVPPSVQALLAARIDALPADAKVVLLDASVVGKTFWSGALAALAGREPFELEPALAELARRELVRPIFPSSMAGDAEYTFWHALLRDVAYGELTRGARLVRHRAAAAWITERVGAALGEDAEIVVAHLERALELAAATGASGEVAAIQADLVDALLATADTGARTDVSRAVSRLRRALELMPGDHAGRPGALVRLGILLNAMVQFPEAAVALREAAAAYRRRGDIVAAAALAGDLSVALGNMGGADEGVALLTEARALLEATPGPGLVRVIEALAGETYVASRFDDATELADVALRVAEELGLPVPLRALCWRGLVRLRRGDLTRGEADLAAAINDAVAAGEISGAAYLMYYLAEFRSEQPSATGHEFDDVIAFAHTHGLPAEVFRDGQIQFLTRVGRWEEAVAEGEALRSWAAARGVEALAFWVDRCLVGIRVEQGAAPAEARGLADRARALGLRQLVVPCASREAVAACINGDGASAQRVLAEAMSTAGPGEIDALADVVRACLACGLPDLARRALTLGGPMHLHSPALAAAAGAHMAEHDGEFAEARRLFADAASAWAAFGVADEHAHALAGLGRCLLALGETGAGVARLQESRQIWERLKAKPRIAEIDVVLATASGGS